MTLTQDTRAALVAKIEGSDIRPEIRDSILALLAKAELSPDDVSAIQDLMQEDIDTDLAAIPELAASLAEDAEYNEKIALIEAEIAQIEQDAQDIEAFVEGEGAKLEGALAEVEGELETMQMGSVRDRLGLN